MRAHSADSAILAGQSHGGLRFRIHVTTTDYDALNRPVTITSPDPDGGGSQTSSVATMSYDINGNLLSATDANGNNTPTVGDGTTTYAYDRANRLTSIDYSDTTPDVSQIDLVPKALLGMR